MESRAAADVMAERDIRSPGRESRSRNEWLMRIVLEVSLASRYEKDARSHLVLASALLLAEIERIDAAEKGE